MNISINCRLSLSKKIRALVDKETSLTLVSQDIVDGKGTAILTLSNCRDFNAEEIGETSIILVPVEIADDTPNSESPVHSTIFGDSPLKHSQAKHSQEDENEDEDIVRKIAVTTPPQKGREHRAVKENVEIPKAFSTLKDQKCAGWIKNMEDLIKEANIAKNKKSKIDIDSVSNVREKAVLQEMKNREEAIDRSAWIVNEKNGIISINDLDIALPLNVPYDLSNISAKKIINSKDLKMLVRDGYVRFISPMEKEGIILKHSDADVRTEGLDVFDNHEQAMDNISKKTVSKTPVIDDNIAMMITEDDLDGKTEDEDMILNLTQGMPTHKSHREIPSSKHTVHANSNEQSETKHKSVRRAF